MAQRKQQVTKAVRISAEAFEALQQQSKDERRPMVEVASWAILEYVRRERDTQ